MTAVSSRTPVGAGTATWIAGRTTRQLAGITAMGLLLGLVVGGIGSRLAMRALFLTSDPGVRGMISDDGFAVGQFSVAATLNLLLATTGIGVIGAFVYAAVRPFLLGPRWLRMIGCAIGGGAVVGSMLVHTGGVDFRALSPRWFAIALFVAIPAVFGALAVPAVEWALRDDGWFQRAPARLSLLPLTVFVFPPLLVLIGVPVALVLGGRALLARRPRLAAVAAHPVTMWAARTAFVAIGVAGIAGLVRDSIILL